MSVADVQREMGDLAGARKSLVLARKAASRIVGFSNALNLMDVARTQADIGDYSGAKVTATKFSKDRKKYEVYQLVSTAQAKEGDIAGAKRTTSVITNAYWKSRAYVQIAMQQAETADKGGAREMLDRAKAAAAQISKDEFWHDPLHRKWKKNSKYIFMSQAYRGIAIAQAKIGDKAGARNSIALAKEAANKLQSKEVKSRKLRNIAKVEAEISREQTPVDEEVR